MTAKSKQVKKTGQKIKVLTPENMEDVAALAHRIHSNLLSLIDINLSSGHAVLTIKNTAKENIVPIHQELRACAAAIYAYARKRRKELTEDDKRKLVEILNAGSIQWKNTPDRIVFPSEEEEVVIKRLEAKGLEECIRRKAEVDKETLLPLLKADPKLAAELGVKVEDDETFTIRVTGIEEGSLTRKESTGRWDIGPKGKKDYIAILVHSGVILPPSGGFLFPEGASGKYARIGVC